MARPRGHRRRSINALGTRNYGDPDHAVVERPASQPGGIRCPPDREVSAIASNRSMTPRTPQLEGYRDTAILNAFRVAQRRAGGVRCADGDHADFIPAPFYWATAALGQRGRCKPGAARCIQRHRAHTAFGAARHWRGRTHRPGAVNFRAADRADTPGLRGCVRCFSTVVLEVKGCAWWCSRGGPAGLVP